MRWSAAQPDDMRRSRKLGVADVDAFLSIQANGKVTGLLAPMEGANAVRAGTTTSPLKSLLQV